MQNNHTTDLPIDCLAPIPTEPGNIVHWGQLYGNALSVSLANVISQRKQGIYTLLTPDSLTADRTEKALRFFLQEEDMTIQQFPDWETLPYDHFSPHQDIISQRLHTLYQLLHLTKGIIIIPIRTALQCIAPQQFIEQNSFVVSIGQPFNITAMRSKLVEQGYYAVNQVMEHGEFCLRGAIFDVFPMGSETPFRLELFDNEIDSIRTFNVETQCTIDKINQINLLPAKEFPLDSDAISQFRQQWRDLFPGNPSDAPIYKNISQGIVSAGIEYYLPLFFQTTENILHYLPKNSIILQMENCYQAAEQFWQEINERYEQYNIDYSRPLLKPTQIYYSVTDFFALVKEFPQIKTQTTAFTTNKAHEFNANSYQPPELPTDHNHDNPLHVFSNFCQQHPQKKIMLCAESAGRREVLIDLFRKHNHDLNIIESWQAFLNSQNKLNIAIVPLDSGISFTKPNWEIIAESQLFGQKILQQRRRKSRRFDVDNIIRNLAELNIGAPVVHIDYGIGRYRGLEIIEDDGIAAEFLHLEYAGNSKLYVPVSSLHLISRYSGVEGENARLHQLGTNKWQKEKEKAAKQIRDVAAELLQIYAHRASRKGIAFNYSEAQYQTFANNFPFEETPDQIQAINNIIKDMKSEIPMDRLICGDVGFGKTEVAMRAAFIAVSSNKQVAVLVPTTLLAQQHFATFQDRFANHPVNIEVISRFRSNKQQQAIGENLAAGKIDILIGTHKLLQSNIKYKSLGLVIIDEEHRFGVQQKERFKKLRAQVEVLTMTATPIPRTLNLAMACVRDLSIIATPPARRLSVKTFVHSKSKSLIREAILREISRGGQVFFLHNKVETIERMVEEIAEIVPEASIKTGHGQMREKALEQIMSDFYHQRFNVLVCTTIIENGIDIPTANTIIINRADNFGLAQLHQLRGRVGRSHHQAYAYLLIPDVKSITSDAKKRLEAISSLENLGAGFTLATHDLEIRGAGNILGEEQSGNIHSIGLSLYTELLDRAVKSLQSNEPVDLLSTSHDAIEVDIKVSAFIPTTYLADVHARLILYKRLAEVQTLDKLTELQTEIIDRFGMLPAEIKNLIKITELKLQAKKLGISKLDANRNGGAIEFGPHTTVEPSKIIQLIQQQNKKFKLNSANILRFKLTANEQKDIITNVEKVFTLLT